MPRRSDIMQYKAEKCFEIILDISDVPDAIFQSATFRRGGAEIDWPLIETKDGRAEFRSPPNLLTLHLTPRLPVGQKDDLTRPVEENLGELKISLMYNDPNGFSTVASISNLQVIPYSVSVCDSCEAMEAATGGT